MLILWAGSPDAWGPQASGSDHQTRTSRRRQGSLRKCGLPVPCSRRPTTRRASPAAARSRPGRMRRKNAIRPEIFVGSDGAGTGTEIDEVRGGLRAHPSGWLEPGGGGGGSGCLGAHLPALARPLRGGGSRRSLRPPPGPPLGAARAGGRGGAGGWSCSTPATGTSRPSTSTRSWWPIHGFKRSYNWLRLSLQAHGRRRAAPRRGAHRRKRPRRALPGMMLPPGRLEPRVGPRSMVGPDRHHGRCDQRYLLGLLRRRRGHHVELPGGVRGDPGQGPVLLALRRPRQPLLEHARGRRQGWTRTPRPRSAAPWRSSASS